MRLSDVLCCIFLTITVTASCVEADVLQASEDTDAQKGKKISKRDAMLVEEFPIYVQRPHSKNHKKKSQTKKIVPLKAKYGGARLKHKPFQTKPESKPHKKSRYQKPYPAIPIPSTYKYKKQNNKSRHRSPYKLIPKPKYEMPKYGLPAFENSGFAEPPQDYKQTHNKNKISGLPDTKLEQMSWLRYTKQDYSIINPQSSYSKSMEDDLPTTNGIYRPKYFTDNSKVIKQYSKGHKNSEHKIIVGGKYAEPPARLAPLPKHQKKEPIQGYQKSLNVSPYVNYKNSNMAFSPQNLNDAFSVDK